MSTKPNSSQAQSNGAHPNGADSSQAQPPAPPAASRDAQQVLAEEFLTARSKILDLAATLDRLDRASGNVDHAAQMQLLIQGLETLLDGQADKARRVQLLMSRHYDPDWRKTYGLH